MDFFFSPTFSCINVAGKNKSEIASAAGVSLRTLRNWLQNPKAQHILQKYGHKQTDRILCPGAVRELCEYFDIQFD